LAGPENSSTPLIYPSMVYIDTVNGISLSTAILTTLVGTPDLPVNNLPDAIAIAALRDINNFHVKGPLTITQNLTNPTYNFFGDGDITVSYVNMNNYDMTGCTFNALGVTGSTPGFIICSNCFVTGSIVNPALIGLSNGILNNCMVGSVGGVPLGVGISCTNCTSYGSPYLGVSLTGGGSVVWSGGSGQLTVLNADNAASLFLMYAPAIILFIDPTCVNGVIYCGLGGIVQDFSSAPCLIYDYVNFPLGKSTVTTKIIQKPANSGLLGVLICGFNPVRVDIMILSATGPQTPNLTSAAVYLYVGATNTLTFIGVTPAASLNAARQQVQAVGPWFLSAGDVIVVNLLGTGAGLTSLRLDVTYAPDNWGGKLSL